MEDFIVPLSENPNPSNNNTSVHNKSQKKLIVSLSLVLVLMVGGFLFIFRHSSSSSVKGADANVPLTTTPVPSGTPIPTDVVPTQADSSSSNSSSNPTAAGPTVPAVPTIVCTGPDGKQFNTTQAACDSFNAAWAPTPTPTPAPIATPTPAPLNVSCGVPSGNMAVGSTETITFTLKDSSNNVIASQNSDVTISDNLSSFSYSNPYSTDSNGIITINNFTSATAGNPTFTVSYIGNSATTNCVTFN